MFCLFCQMFRIFGKYLRIFNFIKNDLNADLLGLNEGLATP